MSVIVAAKTFRRQRFRVALLEITVLPAYRGSVGFLISAIREAVTWSRESRGPRAMIASDVVGALVGSILKRFWDVPLVLNVQGEVVRPGPEYGNRLKRLLIRAAVSSGVRNADLIRTLNPTIQEQIRSLHPNAKVSVLGSRVDTAEFSYRQPRSPGEREPQIVSVGSLSPPKNQATLIRALALVRLRLPDAQLMLVGEGRLKNRLARLAANLDLVNAVRFTGRVPHERLSEILYEADVFAMPSFSEGQPRAILEAQSAGVPVVASDIPAHRTVVTPGETGLLVPPLEVAGWADALVRASTDDSLRRSMSRNARALMEREYGFEHQLDRYADLIRSAVSEHRP